MLFGGECVEERRAVQIRGERFHALRIVGIGPQSNLGHPEVVANEEFDDAPFVRGEMQMIT